VLGDYYGIPFSIAAWTTQFRTSHDDFDARVDSARRRCSIHSEESKRHENGRAAMADERDHPRHIERATMRRVTLRLVPFLMVCHFFALLDRVNIGFAALPRLRGLRMSVPFAD
jgi:hypothetical protein